MQLPDYKRPFDQPDFRGYFRWSAKLSQAIGGSVYHACHEDQLSDFVDKGELSLRSEWALRLPNHGTWSAPGIWVGLNYFYRGNHYGPLLIKFPVHILNGLHFMVFRREGDDRNRYFFVQYESRIPIYSFGKNLWRNVNPEHYFDKRGRRIQKKAGAIYDIVLTNPIKFVDFEVGPVKHPRCISETCDGCTVKESEEALLRVAKREARWLVSQSMEIQTLLNRFPCLEGTRVKLVRADE